MTARNEIPIALERGRRKCFASALEWPGWCRAGRDEALALSVLADYRQRYLPVATLVGESPPDLASSTLLIEPLEGSATTDFGAPGAIAAREREPLDQTSRDRLAGYLEAAWTVFDEAVANGSVPLRKGPRGGGRELDAIFAHVESAQAVYLRKLGIAKGTTDRELVAAIGRGGGEITPAVAGKAWPLAYAVRRLCWHALDHAWEIEDRSQHR